MPKEESRSKEILPGMSMNPRATCLAMVFLILLLLDACSKTAPGPRALSPQEALKSFQLSEDFRVELYASEPEVVDPVEMVFDENGKVYVAEMQDYPRSEERRVGKECRL